MAKVEVDVLLKDGTDESTFINDVTSNTEVDLKNRLPNSPTLVILNVEESYINTLESHSSVISVEVELPTDSPDITYPDIPTKYTTTKSIRGDTGNTADRGDDYLSHQHYLDTDIMVTDKGPVGEHYWWSDPYGDKDNIAFLGSKPSDHTAGGSRDGVDQTYYSNYTGKNVDIVAFEAGECGDSAFYTAHHQHKEWDDTENTGQTRCIPMNWPGLDHASNNQVTTEIMLNSHSTGTLSASGGLQGGFAKKAKLRTAFLCNDGITAGLDSIKGWHNAKSVNSETGLKDPTVLILEWHSPPSNKQYAIKIEDIDSVTDPTSGITTAPDGGWTNDYTAFTSRGIIPFQLQDPTDNSWHWVIPFGWQSQASYHVSIEQCWDAGIVVISNASNAGACYVKESDPRWSGTYCTISGTKTLFTQGYNSDGSQDSPCSISKGTTSTTNWYPFRVYGPHSLDKAIEVAAGMNSEGSPGLDFYSGRGPGIDLIGRGTGTWTAGGEYGTVLADGERWSFYGGTSCAMPTVAGKAACYMEKYYVLNGVWPTPDQVKNAMIAESKPTSMSVVTIDWSNVPSPSDTDIDPKQQGSNMPCLKIKSGTGGTPPNGGWRYGDHAGTPNRQAYWNAQGYNREHTHGKRPMTGVLYPRPRKFDLPRQEEAAT
tara:strand:+ start:264 stop:2222 length:1959 start_codon:yes stop_codon:yes gene_type:complete